MAQEGSGEKTEKATPRKLREARKRGDIPKSRDLGLALGMIAIAVVLWQLVGSAPERLASLTEAVLASPGRDFPEALRAIGAEAVRALLLLSVIALVPIAFVGLLVEFLQTGPLIALDKLQPKLSNLDPVAGFKRMFGADSFVELLKAIAYTVLLFGFGGYLIAANLPDILLTAEADPQAMLAALLHLVMLLVGWTLGAFVFVSILDTAYQHYSFAEKMKMSREDIKEEHKNAEGDPRMKGERRKLAKEWSREGAKGAARKSSVVVVNPTHVSIALLYDAETAPVPTIIGRGLDDLALDMREAAREAGVPVLRNELLARALLRDTVDGDVVPRALFDIVAEVLLWAQRSRERIERETRQGRDHERGPELPVPGEDLTVYPYP